MADQHGIARYLAEHQAEMLEQVIRLADINSGSFNLAGIAEVTKLLREQFTKFGCEMALMPVAPLTTINQYGQAEEHSLAPVLRCWQRPEAPLQILLIGHMDTVFGINHKFNRTQRVAEDKLRGPGVTDMKGGLIVMLWGLRAFERLPQAKKIGWEVLLTTDEEIGSPGSREIIVNCAKRHALGLVFEPAMNVRGDFAGERKGSATFTLVMHGKAAHAGRNFTEGRNAICKMTHVINKIEALNGVRQGVTFNVGFIHGGEAVNVVPDTCMCRVDVRVPNKLDTDWVQNSLNDIVKDFNGNPDFKLELFGKFNRKPKALDAATERLYKLVQRVAHTQGLELTWHASGGVSDGNILSEVGLPNIDTLGVRGEHIHSDQEYMIIPSLAERAELLANLLADLNVNGFK